MKKFDFTSFVQKWGGTILIACVCLLCIINPSFAATGDEAEAAASAGADISGILSAIAEFYHQWSIPVMLVDVVLWAVTKDDRRKEIYKRAVIAMLIVFVGLYFVDQLPGWLQQLSQKAGATIPSTATTTP